VALNPDEVQVGFANGPGIYIAPAGTAMPATAADEWAAPWSILGYLSEDGPTVGQTTDSEDITPWQSIVPIRSVITSRSVTLQFVMWQLNPQTLALYFDTDVPAGTGDIDMEIRTDAPQHIYAVGIDSRDGDNVFRFGFFRASLTDAGDMQIQRGAAVPLDVTLSALDDGGRLARIYKGRSAITPAQAQAGGGGAFQGVQTVGGQAESHARRAAPREP